MELATRSATDRRSRLICGLLATLTAYIADVIAKIAGGWPASRWDELMPWNWTAGEQPLIAEAA